MIQSFGRFIDDESGATAIEYGLIAAIVSTSIIGIVSTIAPKLNAIFGNVSANLK
jgi:pilus assembly protein Flp/PilA